MSTRKYNIGLSLEDNAIGWAVTDDAHHILRAKGQNLIGVRLFDVAETSEAARMKRESRRNIARRKARIHQLNLLFKKEILEVDPQFFTRLKESQLYLEDRSSENAQKYTLFNDENFTDVDYNKAFPTIYHLNKHLLETTEPVDVRLVYLALLHYFKQRGNFYNAHLSDTSSISYIGESYDRLVKAAALYDISLPADVDHEKLKEILCDQSLSNKNKEKELRKFLGILTSKKAPEKELTKLMCGLTATMGDLFKDALEAEDAKLKLGFLASNFEETYLKLSSMIDGGLLQLVEMAKNIFDATQLIHILNGEKFISDAMVKSYQIHHDDKALLKKVLHKYDQKAYDAMFKEIRPNNYAGYVRKYKENGELVRRRIKGGKDRDAFYKYAQGVLAPLPSNDQDIQLILVKIDAGTFMPKQKTRANSYIPNQVYATEVRIILENAANYLPFLKDVDPKYHITNAEKIIQLFTFVRPYFVGPVQEVGSEATPSRFSWSSYKEGQSGPLLPWNLDEKVDLQRSRSAFINQLVGTCTYFPDKKVLPRHSLYYERFTVLDELNTLRVHYDKISVTLKQKIYNNVYKTGKKITMNKIVKFLYKEGVIDEPNENEIQFMGGKPESSLTTYGLLCNIFGADMVENNIDMMEDIIFLVTSFGESKDLLVREFNDRYGDVLSEDQISQCASLGLTGWGNLSKDFFFLEGQELDGKGNPTGWGKHSLLEAMWITNHNHMELLSDDYTYAKSIEDYISRNNFYKPFEEWTLDDINNSYFHATLKRVLWQTKEIILDIKQTMGGAPERIFISRGKGKGTVPNKYNRKAELLALYKKIKDPNRDWVKEIDALEEGKFRSYKIYLYYKQMGRCMYTGKEIPFNDLLTADYDRDHIYPRSLTFYDNLEDNIVLVDRSVNREKSNDYPLDPNIQEKQQAFWQDLLKKGLMTKEKYSRLTRTQPLTDEELTSYINKHFFDTRTGSKTMNRMITKAAHCDGTRVVFTKSSLIDEFRHFYGIYCSNILNDGYFAQDAYITSIAGSVYEAAFTLNPATFVAAKKGRTPEYNLARMYEKDVSRGDTPIWSTGRNGTPASINAVRKELKKKRFQYTKATYQIMEGLFDETVYSKDTANPEKYVSLKTKKSKLSDVKKYGGKTAVTTTCYALVEYKKSSKNEDVVVHSLESVKTMWGIKDASDPKLYTNLKNQVIAGSKSKIKDFKILHFPIKYYTKVEIDGTEYFLSGRAGTGIYIRPLLPLFLPEEQEKDLKKIEKANNLNAYDETDHKGNPAISAEKNLALYDALIDKMQSPLYKKAIHSRPDVLLGARESFIALDVPEQCKLLQALFIWFNGKSQAVDLSPLGLPAHFGILQMSQYLTKRETYIINESPTGLFKRRIKISV